MYKITSLNVPLKSIVFFLNERCVETLKKIKCIASESSFCICNPRNWLRFFSQLWIGSEQILIKPKLDKSLSGNILAWLLTEIDNLCIQLGFNWFPFSLPQRSVNCFTDTNSSTFVLNSLVHVLFVTRNTEIILQYFISK